MPDWLMQLAGAALVPGVAAFVGVKAALARLDVQVTHAAAEAARAHDRLDEIYLGARRAG